MHDYFTNNYVPPLTRFFIFVKAKVVAISLAYSWLTRVKGDSFTFYLCIFSKGQSPEKHKRHHTMRDVTLTLAREDKRKR